MANAFVPAFQSARYSVIRTGESERDTDSAQTTVLPLAAKPSNCGTSAAAVRRNSVTRGPEVRSSTRNTLPSALGATPIEVVGFTKIRGTYAVPSARFPVTRTGTGPDQVDGATASGGDGA